MADATVNHEISVVIPAYNAEAFVGAAIDSALAQSPPPTEIIVVDDGSRDGTAGIVQRYGPPVRYHRQENAGASAARNTGIGLATGEFVAFLDSDDLWLGNHLADALKVFGRHPDLHWFASAYYECEGPEAARVVRGPGGARERLLDADCFPNYFDVGINGKLVQTSTLVVRRRVLNDVGGFKTTMKVGEDLDLFFRIGLLCPMLGYSETPGVVYLRRAESLTGSARMDSRIFLKRVRSTITHAFDRGPEAVELSRRLISHSLANVIRWALRERDLDVLREIHRDYGELVPLKWRLWSRLCRVLPSPLWRLVMGAKRVVRSGV